MIPIANSLIRKNDLVAVTAGREAGKRGRVTAVRRESDRVVVEKVNMVKRHQKPTQKNRQGGIVEKEAAIHLSNVMLVCESCNRPVRVRRVRSEGAEGLQRQCARCNAVLPKKRA